VVPDRRQSGRPMLTRTTRAHVVGLLTAVCLAIPSSAQAGIREPKPQPELVWVCASSSGRCTWVAKSLIVRTTEEKTTHKKPKAACEFAGAGQACVNSSLGNWSNSRQCYVKLEVPRPPKSDPRWAGHTDGSIWACVREQGYDQGRHLVTKWVWLPGLPDTVVTDPLTLAYKAIAKMQLAAPQIGTAPGPDAIGLVNMPVWMWVTQSENTWGPIIRNASVPGLTVTATAQVKAMNWTMGDSQTIRCEGPGTPYKTSFGVKESPTCGHHYRKTSREQPKCRYTVTARADWEITWQSTLGDTGQISMTRQAAVQLRISEARPVLVDPAGSSQVDVPTDNNC
jgi:hypothetical protein